MTKIIRIGAVPGILGNSLAEYIAKKLQKSDYDTQIIPVNGIHFSEETLNKFPEIDQLSAARKTELALLNDDIDLAALNASDFPGKFSENIKKAAILQRGDINTVLVLKTDERFFANKTATVATNSSLYKAQWLYRYPKHKVVFNPGDLDEQLQNLKDNNWNGALFAIEDLKRTGLLPKNNLRLGWMIQKAGQGSILLAAKKENTEILKICEELNDLDTETCVNIEFNFFNSFKEPTDSPIGSIVKIKEEELEFRGGIFRPDGSKSSVFSKTIPLSHTTDIGEYAAQFLLERGAHIILRKKGDLDKKNHIFSTKHLSISQTADLPHDLGISMSDFVSIRYKRLKPVVVRKPIKNVLFTSENAINSLLNNFSPVELDFQNMYCAGRKTKRIIEKNIGKVEHYEKTMDQLVEYLADHLKGQKLTCFCSEEDEELYTDLFEKNTIPVDTKICYKTILTPKKVDDRYQGILFYNTLGIENYLTMNSPDEQIAFCLNQATSQIAKKHFKTVITAKIPTDESLISAVREYFSE